MIRATILTKWEPVYSAGHPDRGPGALVPLYVGGKTPATVWLDQNIAREFWARVDRSAGPNSCWPWIGPLDNYGYGQLKVGRRPLKAHRVADSLANGPIPIGLHVLHRCDNPPCVNPTGDHHLFRGTHAENMADMAAKGRSARGDRSGRRLYPERYGAFLGERNSQAKLTTESVHAIRLRYAAGGVRQIDLAQEYGVARITISRVVLGKRWRDLETAYTERIVSEMCPDGDGPGHGRAA